MASIEYMTKRCPECGNSSILTLDADDYAMWRRGAYVQQAFPAMSAPDREMLITGTHPVCWDKLFADEEDDDVR